MSVQNPFVTLALGAGLNVCEVGTRIGFAVALAPNGFAAQNAGEEARLLFVGAEVDQRWAEQPFANVSNTARALGARVFFVEDDLLVET